MISFLLSAASIFVTALLDWPRRNHRLVIVRQKLCNELLDSYVGWDSEKCVKPVPIEAEARP